MRRPSWSRALHGQAAQGRAAVWLWSGDSLAGEGGGHADPLQTFPLTVTPVRAASASPLRPPGKEAPSCPGPLLRHLAVSKLVLYLMAAGLPRLPAFPPEPPRLPLLPGPWPCREDTMPLYGEGRYQSGEGSIRNPGRCHRPVPGAWASPVAGFESLSQRLPSHVVPSATVVGSHDRRRMEQLGDVLVAGGRPARPSHLAGSLTVTLLVSTTAQ